MKSCCSFFARDYSTRVCIIWSILFKYNVEIEVKKWPQVANLSFNQPINNNYKILRLCRSWRQLGRVVWIHFKSMWRRISPSCLFPCYHWQCSKWNQLLVPRFQVCHKCRWWDTGQYETRVLGQGMRCQWWRLRMRQGLCRTRRIKNDLIVSKDNYINM